MAQTLLDRCIDTHHAYFELKNLTQALDHGTVVASPDCPHLYDANCITRITAAGRAEVDELLALAEVHFSPISHRCFKIDPSTPPEVEARLVVDGYEPTAEVQMVLLGDLASTGPDVDIRPVGHDVDWRSVRELMRADHAESARRQQRRWPAWLTDQFLEQKRIKAPDVQFFLAHVGNKDCGYFSSWPGVGGVGKVEDLYVAPDHRRRGIGTALIAHCVDDARRRGASIVTIGAAVDEAPKSMYADLGFRPVALHRSYVKLLEDSAPR